MTGDEAAAPGAVRPRRRRITSFAFLGIGLLVALYLGTQGPKDQHVRVVLGDGATEVTALALVYLDRDGDVAREAHLAYTLGAAPRVVAHEPQLPSGEYRLGIEIETREGRRSVQRQVTLGGGSTQIDVSRSIVPAERPLHSSSIQDSGPESDQ